MPCGAYPAFRLSQFLRLWRSLNPSPLRSPERHTHLLQQRQPLGVGAGRGGDANVHSLGLVHFGVIDLRKNQLVFDAQGIIPPSVEALRAETAEIADARQRHVRSEEHTSELQ